MHQGLSSVTIKGHVNTITQSVKSKPSTFTQLERTCEQTVKNVKKNTNSPPHFSQSSRSDTQLVKHSNPKHLSSVSGKKRSIIDKEDKSATQTMTKKSVHRSAILPESFHMVWAQKLSLLRAFKKETGHLDIDSSLDSEVRLLWQILVIYFSSYLFVQVHNAGKYNHCNMLYHYLLIY